MLDGIEVVVRSIADEALDIRRWEFARADGGRLPPFTAGAHIDVRLADGLTRSYSLCNSPEDHDRYVVAVHLSPTSRGGSRHMHEHLKVGDRVVVSPPRNNFPLMENARHIVFIAGGIGITPIFCMIQRLETRRASWELHYSTRTREHCAFLSPLEELERRHPGRVHFTFDHEPGGRMMDIAAVIAAAAADAHFYCCGPAPMLDGYVAAAEAGGRSKEHVHLEHFSARNEAARDGGFTVVLGRSNRSFVVSPGSTILETLMDAGIDLPFSCREGICGLCETYVQEGLPDHRDSVLGEAERAAGDVMMICCSGSKTDRLVLDL